MTIAHNSDVARLRSVEQEFRTNLVAALEGVAAECMTPVQVEDQEAQVAALEEQATDATTAIVSSATIQGGTYHPLQICRSLGYTTVDKFGGTGGKVCGTRGDINATDCMKPGVLSFDGNGDTAMPDDFGPVFQGTVWWVCGN